jgi:cell fate regulator YaaT (PSP1 superfamily)
MIDNNIETPIDNSQYVGFVGVKFFSAPRAYFFGVKDMSLKLGDKVVVDTMRGTELGEIAIAPIEIEKYDSELGLKPVLRVASDVDIKMYETNQKDARFALEICENEANKLNLKMNLISCEYTLDKSKILFSYLADERVDFRELLKVLASRLHTRIELRQVGSRDKAKMVGGLGICGLPLCCSTFLNEFDGISINRAKNQMLAINIPKLSGQCGKLICCLKYEDDAYTEERKRFPELGTKVFIDKVEYAVTSINIISNVVKVENPDDIKFLPLDEFNKQTGYNRRKDRDYKNDKEKGVRKQ